MVAEIVGPSTQIILELLLPTCFWKLSLGHGQMSKATDPASWHSHPSAACSSPPEFECDAKGLSLVFGLSKAAVLANASPTTTRFWDTQALAPNLVNPHFAAWLGQKNVPGTSNFPQCKH